MRIRIRDPVLIDAGSGMEKFGPGINILHPERSFLCQYDTGPFTKTSASSRQNYGPESFST
jgi:hypothetical protein